MSLSFFNLILTGGYLLYSVVLVFAITTTRSCSKERIGQIERVTIAHRVTTSQTGLND